MSKEIIMIAGLGFGDEGKGSVVDFLARYHGAELVVRYNGGPQAAHNVVSGNIHHCFAQFGSGTLAGANTHLSAHMLVDLLALEAEAEALKKKGIANAFNLICLDARSILVTPFHKILNQMREIARGESRNGSCGMGVGEAAIDARMGIGVLLLDIFDPKRLRRQLDFLWRHKIDHAEQICAENQNNDLVKLLRKLSDADYVERLVRAYERIYWKYEPRFSPVENALIKAKNTVIFEGAQGILLHEHFGFYPHITHFKTGFESADSIVAGSNFKGKVSKIGILRAYATRHGAGPFVSEDAKLARRIPDTHNGYGDWQRQFRVGWFDLVASRYALACAGNVDSLAITNLDRFGGMEKIKVCTAYEYFGPKNKELKSFCELKRGNTVTAIKNNGPIEKNSGLTEIMKYCRPSEWQEFEGWGGEIKRAKNLQDVPREAREYIEFLGSNRGLGKEISLISVGPTWKNKIPFSP